MNKAIKTILFLFLFAPFGASAEVMHYSLCTMNEGSTIQDVEQWMQDWRKVAKKEGIKYEVRLLVGHVTTPDEMLPNFYIEGSAANLADHAAGWAWWYSDDEDAVASSQQLFGVATCGGQAVFRSIE